MQCLNQQLSSNVVLYDYYPLSISQVTGYTCDGNSLTFQPKIYTYQIDKFNIVKRIYIKISGSADDYKQIVINDSISLNDGTATSYSSDYGYFKVGTGATLTKTQTFTMNNSSLVVKFGAVNTCPSYCYINDARFEIKLFFN